MNTQRRQKNSEKNPFEDDIEKIDKSLRQGQCTCDKNDSICMEEVKKIKDLKSTENLARDLRNYRNKMGDTLAHSLVTHHTAPEALQDLIDLSPSLAVKTRIDSMEGQTILHIAICKRNYSMALGILQHLTNSDREKSKTLLLKASATGHRFKNTVMLGQLPLSVAALTLEEEMVKLLLDQGAHIRQKNSDGETVFHSLIRYAAIRKDLQKGILEMMRYLHEEACQPYSASIRNPQIPYVWHIRNKSNMTPLQLAASLGQADMFEGILNLNRTYQYTSKTYGLIGNVFMYDVTEIDTTSQAEWERYPPDAPSETKPGEKSWKDPGHSPVLSHTSLSVLEIICQLKTGAAYRFLCIDAIKELVLQKWHHYKWFVGIYAIIHLVMMILITAYAVYKTKVLNSETYSDRHVGQGERSFAITAAVLSVLYALFFLWLEINRLKLHKYRWDNLNMNYRMMLVIFSLALLVDAIWFFGKPSNNYFLIVALIIGWSFMGFYLRTLPLFSFYTVMLLEILAGDMIKIAIIVMCQFIAFSVALYSSFLNADSNEGFENFGRAMVTVFNLMLGLKDLQTLNDAREPWMAILLYIFFVISTYVILLNSLIAIMALVCEEITQHRHQEGQLQRLLVILMIETMLIPKYRHLPHSKSIRRYGKPVQEFRSYVEVKSLQLKGKADNKI